jgi:DNA-binding MarR family transcriptional regulator
MEPAITETDRDAPWMRALHADTGYLFYRLGLRSGSMFNAMLAEHGFRQRELSEKLGYDPSAIVSLVDDLQELGFAERRPFPGDRRHRIVVLTEKGHAALRDTDMSSRRITEDLMAPLDADERATLHALLLRVAEPERD